MRTPKVKNYERTLNMSVAYKNITKKDQLQIICLVVQYLYLNIQNFRICIIENTQCYQDHTILVKQIAMQKKNK